MPYSCEICNYHTSRKDNFYRHIESEKHKEKYKENPHPLLKKKIEKEKKFFCKKCNKRFTFHSGLSRHKKICHADKPDPEEIINALSSLIFEFKIIENQIIPTYISAGSLKIYGYSPEILMENFKLTFLKIHPDDKERVIQKINEFKSPDPKPFFNEFRVVQNGTVKWIWTQAFPERLDDGMIVWRGQDTDITAMRENKILSFLE